MAHLPPGQLPTPARIDAMMAAFAANGFLPLSQAQILAAVGPGPAFPTGLPRIAGSNDGPDGKFLGRQDIAYRNDVGGP